MKRNKSVVIEIEDKGSEKKEKFLNIHENTEDTYGLK